MSGKGKFLEPSVAEREMERLREEHRTWKANRRKEGSPFFPVFLNFREEFLKDISGGALKLYLLFGFYANTYTGECWLSTEKISAFFDNDERTIKKWIHELEELGLIERIQLGYRRVANTFLRPYPMAKKQIGRMSHGEAEK